MHIIAQLAGISGAALNIISYQMKDNSRLYLLKGISGVLFALQFFMLGNLTAALLNLVNLFRAAALLSSRCKSNRLVFLLIQLIYIACCVFTFGKGDVVFGGVVMAMVLSVVTTLIQLLETFALMTRNGKLIRLAQVCVISPVWLVNNFLTGSIFTGSLRTAVRPPPRSRPSVPRRRKIFRTARERMRGIRRPLHP